MQQQLEKFTCTQLCSVGTPSSELRASYMCDSKLLAIHSSVTSLAFQPILPDTTRTACYATFSFSGNPADHVASLLHATTKIMCISVIFLCSAGLEQSACVLQPMQAQQPVMPHMPGFRPQGPQMGPGPRPMLPSDYKLAPPPTNAYQTDLALAAAANSMAPMPQVCIP